MNKEGKIVNIVKIVDIEKSVRRPDSPVSIFNFDNALQFYKKINGIFTLDVLDVEKNSIHSEIYFNTGILRSWRTAVDCFGLTIFSGSILFASISVECILNHDLILDEIRRKKSYKWIDLTPDNLKLAYNNGLPTKILLDENEDFSNSKFVTRRNKVAHGDFEGYSSIQPSNEILDLEIKEPTMEQALDQIEKAKNFIIEWSKNSPSIRLH